MRIAIIGAGIVGVTTAHELVGDGHEVSVFERAGSVAAEASFANAGLVAPGWIAPWAAPGMPAKVVRGLFSRHPAVRLSPALNLGWAWQCWRACRPRAHQANRARMQRLAVFSRQQLRDTTRHLNLDYERSDGVLVLLRSARDLALAQPSIASLKELGIRFSVLDARQCAAVEPGLNRDTPLHAGIHLIDDAVGNCRQFALLLRNDAQAQGAAFRFHADVRQIVPGIRPRLVYHHAEPDDGGVASATPPSSRSEGPPTVPMPIEPVSETFDAIVVCAALGSVPLLARHGLKLRLAAVHGYSVTAPIRHLESHPEFGLRSAVVDAHHEVAVSRLGSRLRVAGGAEIGSSPQRHNTASLASLYKVLNDWFPGVARMGQAQLWKGARPMLPDGPPLLGASGLDGIWLNLGHGDSGWALASGSARVLADLIGGRPPAIDLDGLGVDRVRR